MHVVIIVLLVVGLLFAPSLWVKHVLRKYGKPADRYPGTGAEFARHLLRVLGLEYVKVEESPAGDHYDPDARAVRLSPDNYKTGSLTAITVAAHEVGHAVQHYDQYRLFNVRSGLARVAVVAQKGGQYLVIGIPIAMLITRSPAAGLALGGIALLTVLLTTLVHLVTLPVELDASFGRAMPMLIKGDYLKPGDEPHARRLLRAAALTYVAGSLISLLNVWRWLRLPR